MAKTIYVLNGPNLNLLGLRQPEIYGSATLKDVEALCRETAKTHGYEAECRQSAREGEIVEWIHEAFFKKAAGVIINPAGYSHTSVAILDAILGTKLPVVEIHISNIHQRDEFRHHSFISKGAKGVICGFGIAGYAMAVNGLVELIKNAKD
jgi:3-dehydroquinate dehydratase-2